METDETPAEIETNSEVTIYHSPVAGKLISLDEVADKTFASGSMGRDLQFNQRTVGFWRRLMAKWLQPSQLGTQLAFALIKGF